MVQMAAAPIHLPFLLLQMIMPLPPDTRRGPLAYVLCLSLPLESIPFFFLLLSLLLVMISLVIFSSPSVLCVCAASPASHVHFILQIFTARLCVVVQFLF